MSVLGQSSLAESPLAMAVYKYIDKENIYIKDEGCMHLCKAFWP